MLDDIQLVNRENMCVWLNPGDVHSIVRIYFEFYGILALTEKDFNKNSGLILTLVRLASFEYNDKQDLGRCAQQLTFASV